MIDKGIEHEMIYPQEIFNVIQSIFWGARISFKIKQNHQVGNEMCEVTCLTNWSAPSRKKRSYELIAMCFSLVFPLICK